jgi:hypothetical protein
MTDSNGTDFGGLFASSECEMFAFDSLPRELRDLLNYAAEDWSALQLARAAPVKTVSTFGFAMTTGGDRERLVAKIREAQAHIAPLKQPRRLERPRRGGAPNPAPQRRSGTQRAHATS